jgi:hypothetical protein
VDLEEEEEEPELEEGDGMGRTSLRLRYFDSDEELADLLQNPGDTGFDIPGSEKRRNEEYYPSPHHQLQFAEAKKDREYFGSAFIILLRAC